MFSDVERSPSWHSPPLGADFAPHSYPPGSTTRPPVQSGWFPLQDATTPSSSRAPQDMYSDPSMLPPTQRSPWPQADPYSDTRPRGSYDPLGTPTTPSSSYSPLYGYAATPSGPPSGFGWQDARPLAPPPGHATGLEHLHAAAQGMHAMMGRKKHHREISVGRWTSDEHRVFLKGLELYQGPSWGEIARMIGTRTSTQVRTHAQKFFTKLARSNQVLPYFENQIQKERARLISQGAVPGSAGAATTVTALSTMDLNGHSSVTPTSTSAHSYAFTTLSPPRKREYPPAPPPLSTHPGVRYDDPTHGYGAAYGSQPRPPMPPQHAPLYPMADMGPPLDPYKSQQHQHRLDSPPSELLGLRKPTRLEYANHDHLPTHHHPSTAYSDHAMMAYTPTGDAYRDPYPPVVHGDWSDAATRSWPPSIELPTDAPHAGDPDSLPSVTRLLYRGGAPAQA